MVVVVILFISIFFILSVALRDFVHWKYEARVKRKVSWYGLISLALLYFTIALGFSGIYMILELLGYQVLYANGALPIINKVEHILNVIYFSMTTLFSIGYGEWIPVGVGKLVAAIEGLIGYLLPPAFIISYMEPHRNEQ